MKKWMILLLALALTASMMTGAALAAEKPETDGDDTAPAADTADAEQAEDPFAGLVRLGEETEGCGMVKLTNQTQDDIMMINIKRSDDWQWSENLLAEGEILAVGDSAVLCFELPAPAEEDETAEDAEDAEAAEDAEDTEATEDTVTAEEPVTYDLQIIFVGWTGGPCHNIVLTDVKDAQIMRAWNSIPYLVYTSIATEEEVDMQEAEQEIAVAEYYASQSSGGNSSSGGSSGGGNSDGCVGSGALFY